MFEGFSRTELIFGKEAMKKLKSSRVAVFGIGGVGGYIVEALVRSGIGAIDLIDNDTVCLSNFNRQIIAVGDTLGKYKVDAACERILSINPDCVVRTHKMFYTRDNSSEFDFSQYDYIADAIDTVSGKIEIIVNAQKAGVPVISSMGAGNKTDPTAFEVTDIYKTSVCPLARVMRYELKKRGIKKLKVVYSKEKPISCTLDTYENAVLPEYLQRRRKQITGSNAFVPPVAGLIIAGEIIKDLTGFQQKA